MYYMTCSIADSSDRKPQYGPAAATTFIQTVPDATGGRTYSRLSLLLSSQQMALEHYPLPVDIGNSTIVCLDKIHRNNTID